MDTDSSNSGTPTSKTPINKKKGIPNSRKKTENHIGGQKGHLKSKLEKFKENEITENIEYHAGCCPGCGGRMKQMDEEITKDETDYEVVVVKKRHHFHSYECMECGAVYRQTVPYNLKHESFTEEKAESIFRKFNHLLLKGIENNKNDDSYYGNEERKLLNRIAKYKNNYFAWVTNFRLPFTNNLSERSLRGTKSKMKISGQFQSLEYAGYYASVKSYIETCYRNGIDEYTALRRLCDGKPYTVAEILGKNE